ncbi:MAG: 3-isopropylmalate dehydratase small subunit [Synergistaceae bacterium]|nr:3-isopropylmalate dehydratase small subunit [Synergistaceae bacterium]MDD4837930.1 3-isopropylmalate dehydratase small subunit [Synergistaceae bacterium]MDO9543748.1 3-isopropylmalate dehydratase small subunit [Synergistaceae bacterium]
METTLKGNAWVYGDNVDTDVIIPARYLVTSDERSLAAHCMEDIDETYAKGVSKGDVITAGNNFGCGSSREHAPIAIKGSGASCVIAKSFARIFYRNAINIGLPILECTETDRIAKGDLIEIDLTKGTITNRTKGETYHAKPFPEFLQSLIGLGGLVPYVRTRLSEQGR